MKSFFLSVVVGFGLLLMPRLTSALVPVEGVLLGEARREIQTDPLNLVFSNINSDEKDVEYQKMKNYQSVLRSGTYFANECSILGPISYSTPWKETQAKRSTVAALQHIGLDRTIKAIGAYGKVLQINEGDYGNLVSNLVDQYCSENVTVMALKTIRSSLYHYYQNPDPTIIPNIESSRYVTEAFKAGSLSMETRSKEFHYAIRNFRAFCSWGGDIDDYRLLPPYLKNPFIMSLVMRSMYGLRFVWNQELGKMIWEKNAEDVTRVVCNDLICRPQNRKNFNKLFPLSSGSTGVLTDVNKLYCQHFRFLDFDQKKTIPAVKEWMKTTEPEESLLESGFFISLLTGVPDPFMVQKKYSDIPAILKSSVDERWSNWSKTSISSFSKDLLFEESLRVRARPRGNLADMKNDLLIDFHVTLGEMDRVFQNYDKVSMNFDLKLSKNWLRSLIKRRNIIAANLDVEGEEKLKADLASYIDLQLKTKEKLFTQKLWNDDFGRLIAEELLRQVLSYRGGYFDSYKDEMISIPVRFSYGIFALSYLRYRHQVAKGATKLNL